MYDTLRKCLDLLDAATRKRAIFMAVLVLIGTVLEALGIGLIFPFIKLVTEPQQIHGMTWLTHIYGDVPPGRETDTLIVLTGGLIAIFVVKNLFLLGVSYAQARYVALNEAILANRLFRQYLYAPYTMYLARNSAELIRNITDTVTRTFSGAIISYLTLATELLVVVALVVVLLIAEPLLTMGAVAALGFGIGTFYFLVKRRMVAWGKDELAVTKDILQSLQQGFHSVKEVRISGAEDHVLSVFRAPRLRLAWLRSWTATVSQAPRLWVETIMVSGVLSLVILIITAGGGATKIIAALTLFAAAVFRLIPSMNRILMAMNTIRVSQEAVDEIHRDLRTASAEDHGRTNETDAPRLVFNDAIEIRDLRFHYPAANSAALSGVTLRIGKGESIGLAGASGAGKTTLVDILLGLLVPDEGMITVDGIDISPRIRSWQRQVGYVPQAIYLIDDTIRRNIAFGVADTNIDEAQVWNALRMARLDAFVQTLADGLDTVIGEHGVRLSGGQRQRIGIARALYRDPAVLVLDEATSSLDTETEHEISNAIDALSGRKTLIIVAHRLSTIRHCQRVVYMEKGRLIDSGSFDQLTAANGNFRRLVELSAL